MLKMKVPVRKSPQIVDLGAITVDWPAYGRKGREYPQYLLEVVEQKFWGV